MAFFCMTSWEGGHLDHACGLSSTIIIYIFKQSHKSRSNYRMIFLSLKRKAG